MSDKELDSSIVEFRKFLNDHPKLIQEVRKSDKSWQPYYEKWVLLGESDPYWDKYKSTNKKESNTSGIIEKLQKWTENKDIDQIQEKVKDWNQTITVIQGMLNQFQDNNQGNYYQQRFNENKYRD